ncbi:translation initiation factor IF-2 [Bacteroidia bacterium]|nr:translation initiation factor IF-2 [Bacteroidia bacterium]
MSETFKVKDLSIVSDRTTKAVQDALKEEYPDIEWKNGSAISEEQILKIESKLDAKNLLSRLIEQKQQKEREKEAEEKQAKEAEENKIKSEQQQNNTKQEEDKESKREEEKESKQEEEKESKKEEEKENIKKEEKKESVKKEIKKEDDKESIKKEEEKESVKKEKEEKREAKEQDTTEEHNPTSITPDQANEGSIDKTPTQPIELIKTEKKEASGPKQLGKIDLTPKPKSVKSKTTDSKPPVEIEKPQESPAPQIAVEDKPERIMHTTTKFTEAKQTGTVDLSKFNKPAPTPKPNTPRDNVGKRVRVQGGKVNTSTPYNNNNNNKPAGSQFPKKDYKNNSRDKKPPIILDPTEIAEELKRNLAKMVEKDRGKKSQYSKHKRDKRHSIAEKTYQEKEDQRNEQKILKVSEFITANELAVMMSKSINEIIKVCFDLGQRVGINQRLDAELIKIITDELGFEVEFIDAELLHESSLEEMDNPEDLQPRAPIITVMGHVDHGKTSLLDHIRNTNVIAGEAGGITQKIGAYEVVLEDGRKVTFLDTPGHEAFTAMRARGAKITDIAIIVIAADDKIMPQTIEAINHAQSGNVPIVFAINKIDKNGADPQRIKQELAEMNLLIEEWGGKLQSQDISAKKGIGVKELLEKVLLQADIMDLKANPNKKAKGTVIESSKDKGRGYIANVLVQEGTLKIGDSIFAGKTYGRIRAMFNERNQPVKTAGPSTPVLMLGLNDSPQAGDLFRITDNDKEAKDFANKLDQIQREQKNRTKKHVTLEEIGRRLAIGDFKELNLIVKADVDGSVEAVSDALLKLSTPQIQVNVIHKAVGEISETDVNLAASANAIIIGFNVRPSKSAKSIAENEQIDIRLYSIIYKATEEIKEAMEGLLEPTQEEKNVCNVEVREVFHITKVGNIAGCMVLNGKIARNTKIRIIRDGIVVFGKENPGKIKALKRFKDDAKEIVSGQDCGISIDGFNDFKVGDIIEGYEIIETKSTL